MKVKKLPLEDAISLSAKENLERDQRLRLIETPSEDCLKLYREEAQAVLEAFGESYLPDFPDHHLIRVENRQ